MYTRKHKLKKYYIRLDENELFVQILKNQSYETKAVHLLNGVEISEGDPYEVEN